MAMPDAFAEYIGSLLLVYTISILRPENPRPRIFLSVIPGVELLFPSYH